MNANTDAGRQAGQSYRAIPMANVDLKAYLAPAFDPGQLAKTMTSFTTYASDLVDIGKVVMDKISGNGLEHSLQHAHTFAKAAEGVFGATGPTAFNEYLVDFFQRSVLFTDLLRRRGNQFVDHEAKGCPTVLAFDFDVIVDGGTLDSPVNYSLVRIRPPTGVVTDDTRRPYIIIDPRAGHGSGIGGFKNESEVGVALHHGHPVYFVIFSPHPVKGQTLADVCRAEAHFVREVHERHPQAAKPVIVGNCQGGWAAMLLAATNPDLTGPVVINGSPMAYWSGVRGRTPLRYVGGLVGGVWPAMMMADLGNGEFDGANLVSNFESMNPSNTWWHKYYDVFANIEEEGDRFLEFERWWSGFYFMNEIEIRWIVENLFIGNRLARNGVNLDRRLHVDLRHIRAPVIVFASHGDTITPPPQALNWIADTYSSVREIKARGQKVVYTVHDTIGHLGIFVSSSVARKQHEEISSTLEFIEALSPGLYEMMIVQVKGEGMDREFSVAFEERDISDILALDDNREDEKVLAAAAHVSEVNARLYELTLRPLVQSMTSEASAKALVDSNPIRTQRMIMSDQNPLMAPIQSLADQVREQRAPASPTNPFIALERAAADMVADALDLFRDTRDGMIEAFMFGVFGSPLARSLAQSGLEDQLADMTPPEELESVPDVRMALEHIDLGGYVDGVIRMLILLARSRKSVRRDRLERSNEVLNNTDPFASLSPSARSRVVHRQTIIVEFEPERAVTTLSALLPNHDDRQKAIETCRYIAGSFDEMEPNVRAMFSRFYEVLGIPQPVETPIAPPPKAASVVAESAAVEDLPIAEAAMPDVVPEPTPISSSATAIAAKPKRRPAGHKPVTSKQ